VRKRRCLLRRHSETGAGLRRMRHGLTCSRQSDHGSFPVFRFTSSLSNTRVAYIPTKTVGTYAPPRDRKNVRGQATITLRWTKNKSNAAACKSIMFIYRNRTASDPNAHGTKTVPWLPARFSSPSCPLAGRSQGEDLKLKAADLNARSALCLLCPSRDFVRPIPGIFLRLVKILD
jgi:hypothetical protein